MKVRCINNSHCETLSLNREYPVVEEGSEYFVVVDDLKNETTCKKSRFIVVEDNEITKKAKATLMELNYQLEHEFKDIKDFVIRKNSKGEIKEISIKFKYN